MIFFFTDYCNKETNDIKKLTCRCINTRLNCFNKSNGTYKQLRPIRRGERSQTLCFIGIGNFWPLLASARFAEQASFMDACTSQYPVLAVLPWVYSPGH